MKKSIILTECEFYMDTTDFMFFTIRKVMKLSDTYKIRVDVDDICSYKPHNLNGKRNGITMHSSIQKSFTWVEIVGKDKSCLVEETPEQIKRLIKNAE